MEEDWQIGEGPDGQDMLAHEERGDLRMAQGQKAQETAGQACAACGRGEELQEWIPWKANGQRCWIRESSEVALGGERPQRCIDSSGLAIVHDNSGSWRRT